LAKKNIDFYKAQLRKHRSDAVPNVNLGYQPLDQGSNHVRPYSGMVFEMGIPLFNRNQGNIATSKIKIEQGKVLLKEKENEVINEVWSAYQQVENSRKLVAFFTPEFIKQMDELSANAKLNYEKRNISLIEYLDYQRAFIDNQKDRIDIINTFYQQINLLSFSIGKSVNNINK
jgi:cobalt-zinc-cadmium efflux system outer membrane protein